MDMLSHEPLRILLVEDSVGDALLIGKALAQAVPHAPNVQKAENLSAALRLVGEDHFDVMLLDLSLPDSSGFSGLLTIQNMAPKLPVVILTAYADEELALSAVEHGAQDYLFKDKTNGPAIKRALDYAIRRKRFEGELITRANFDPLTGLANRPLFESRLDMALARSKRQGTGFGIFFIDLDRFKQVNDTFGHATGDQLLTHVAQCLKQSVRPYDTAARFGGDEFALLVEGIENPLYCRPIAEKIIQGITTPPVIRGKPVMIGVSIGIVIARAHEALMREDLLHRADEAMYQAKTMEGSAYCFCEGALNASPAAA